MKQLTIYLRFIFLLCISSFSFQIGAQCDISNITVETSDCESGDAFVGIIDFEYSGDVGVEFSYTISNQQSGTYPYDALPMVLDIFGLLDAETLTITISDDTGPGCSSEVEFMNPCFENCEIYGISAIPGECNDQDEFVLTVDFEHFFTSDFFDLHIDIGNGIVIEDIPYTSLPYTVSGVPESCNSDFTVGIYDSEDDGCIASKLFDPVCCSFDLCDLSNLVVEVEDCDGTEFGVNVNLDFIGTSDEFNYTIYDDFGVEVEVGVYTYAALPLNLSFDNTTSSDLKIVISDINDITCNIFQDFDNPCYQECLIYNLTATPYDCIDGLFALEVDFEHEFTSGSFDLHITYPFGVLIESISYTSLPYTVTGLQEDCSSAIEVLVCDSENGNCLDVITLNPVCCEDFCVFSNLIIETTECENGAYAIDVDLSYVGNAAEFDYILYDNQSNVLQSGSYLYADLPLTLAVDNTTSIVNYVVISDQDDQECVIDGFYDNPCYEQEGVCIITGFDFNENPICEDGFILAEWFVFSENTSESGYDIFIDGVFVAFLDYAGEGPYDIDIEAPNTGSALDEVFELTICDIENPDCCYSIDVENPCYESEPDCDLSDMIIDDSDCDGGEFILEVAFDYEGNSSDLYNYTIYGSQDEVIETGVAEYSQLPLSVLIANSDSEWFLIEIIDSDDPDCTLFGEFLNPCYQPECTIYSIDFGANPFCVDGTIETEWFIFADNTSESGYDIFIDGAFVAFLDYAGEGPYDIDIEAPGTPFFTITACDNDSEDCCYSWELENPCFENTTDCIIGDIITEVQVCEEGLFDIWIDFEYSNTTDQFIISGNGLDYGIYNYSDLPITITELDSDCEFEYEFIIEDALENACSNFIEIGIVCCEESECVFSNLLIETSDCDDGQFDLVANFNFEGVTNDFYDYFIYDQMNDVIANGVLPYDQAPLTISVANTISEYFLITILGNDNDVCSITGEVINPCFEESEECQMTTLDFGETPTCENGIITTEWLIDGNNTSEVGYDIFVNGLFQLFVSYEDDAWYDFDVIAPEDEFFTLTVCDNDNADCCIELALENPCFEPPLGDCNISDLSATVTVCEGNAFDVLIDFDYENTGDQFSINGNGMSYGTYSYADLPVTLDGLEADCNTEFEFEVKDLADDDCYTAIDLGTVCCEDFNSFEQTIVEYTIEGNVINIFIEVSTTLLTGCAIDVYIDGELSVILEGESTSFELGPFDCGTDQVVQLRMINTCTEEMKDVDIDLSDVECITSNNNTAVEDLLVWSQNQKQLTIDPNDSGRYDLQILSSEGRLVHQNRSISYASVINLDQVQTGIYFVRIVNLESGNIGLKKIFVY